MLIIMLSFGHFANHTDKINKVSAPSAFCEAALHGWGCADTQAVVCTEEQSPEWR